MADYIGDFQTRSAARRYRDEVRAYNDYINTQIDASKLRQDVIEQTSEQEKERIMEEAKASKTGGGIYGAVQFKGAADDIKWVKKRLEAKRQDRDLSLKLARQEIEEEAGGAVNPLIEEAAEVGDAHEELVGERAKLKLKEIRNMSNEEKVGHGLEYATEAKNAEEALRDASKTQKLLKGAGELAAKGGAAINAIYGGVEAVKSVQKSIDEGHVTIDGNNNFEKAGNVVQMASGVSSGLGLMALGASETSMLAALTVVAPELLLAGAVLGGASALIGEVGTFEEEDEKSKEETEATERAQAAERAVEMQEREKLVSAAKAGIPLGGSTRRVTA